jgi:Tol biopolymer transport system component
MKIKLITTFFLIVILGAMLSPADSYHQTDDPGVLLRAAMEKEAVEGDLQGAIDLYKQIVAKYEDHRAIAAKAQLHIGLCYEKLGLKEAQKAFQNVIDTYPEQTESVKTAREKLSLLLKATDVVEKKNQEFQARRVWTGRKVDSSGKISPDGKYLSFVDWDSGNLAIREIATGKKTFITKNASWKQDAIEFAMESVWSRDGKKLVYLWENDSKKRAELHIVGMSDQQPRLLYQVDFKNSWVQPLDWSPDGKDVLTFFTEERLGKLCLLSVGDGSVRIIKTFSTIDPYPMAAQFSPDGRFVAYEFPQKEFGREKNIAIISADEKTDTPLIVHPANDNLLGWSPDGHWILFKSDRTGAWDAWTIQVAEGKAQNNPQILRRGIGSISSLGFSQDGSFYYGVAGGMYDVFTAKIDPETGIVVESPKKMPLPYEGYNFYPDWSPDGKDLLYISRRGPRNRQSVLCIYSEESGIVRMFPFKDEFVGFGYPCWCPDGRHVLFLGEHIESGKGLYKADAQTGEITLLIRAKENESSGVYWSPVMSLDGKTLFYDYENSAHEYYRILARDLATGKETELLRHPPLDNNQLSLSPDGKRLAVILREEKNMRMVKVMPVEGGDPVELYRFELEGREIVNLDWSPEGRYVYFDKRTPVGWELWRVPSDGGEAEYLQLRMFRFLHLNIHPDGQRIVFSSMVGDMMLPEIWVMENFLPNVGENK